MPADVSHAMNRNREYTEIPCSFSGNMLKREKISGCIDFAHWAAYNKSITAET
jgi:hypothetical protein